MPLLRPLLLSTATVALCALVAAAPRPASACGGTFCDTGPTAMPVDQSGESILFVIDEGFVEAHVQIEYEGDPEQFAWIVPIMAEPEVSVGSQLLFDRMLAATVPTFTVNTTFEGDCDDDRPRGLACARFESVALSDGGGGIEQETPNGQPFVRVQDTIGAYEYAVLEGGTVEGIGTWLDDNGYARDDEAPKILETYLDEGFLFVAFKLRPGAGVDEIHPVVLRYQGTEPCIPLRLTRIAAVEDMKVRAFFLGDTRVVSSNYRHVELNPLRFDWSTLGTNYDQVVSEAVDAEGADGRAFVTEYAGPSAAVDRTGLSGSGWGSEGFAAVTPQSLTRVLEEQDLITCSTDPLDGFEVCGPSHPLLFPLLRTYFPPPPDVSADDFYLCTSCYPEVDATAWDPAGFMIAFEEQIVGPAEHALDVLGANPYLTRLYTMISPGEMTSDPLFHERPDLPEVSNQWSATQVIHCEENDRYDFPDGTSMYLEDDGQQPDFSEMSAAQLVQEFPLTGAPMVLLDAAEDIDAELAASNELYGPTTGCECRSTRRRMHGAGWLGLLLLLGLRTRSRRPRQS